MKLSIVTLNFKKPQLTIACMESLYAVYKQQFEKGEFELIIVDNLSGDDSVTVLRDEIKKQKYKNYTLAPNDKNVGFGAGNNFGVKKAKGEYLLFLNNDTVVKSGIDKMVNYLDKHIQVSLLGGPLKNFDGSPQPSAGKFYTPLNALLLLIGMQRFDLLDSSPDKIEEVDWVKGALLMMRKNAFDKLGGFDEKIFMYTEDMELCYRAKLVGYHCYFYPDVEVLHKDQGSSNRTFAIVNIYKNLQYFYKKHRPVWEYLLIRFVMRTKARALIFLGKLLRNSYLINTYEQALAVS